MSIIEDHVAEIWQQLVNEYHWQYTPQASAIIEQMRIWCMTETIDDPKIIRRRLIAHYNEMLYSGLQQQAEDAAYDLQRACIQAGRRSKYSADELEDFAADAVMIVIRKLGEIQPQHLLAYAFACMRNAPKALAKEPKSVSLNDDYDRSNVATDQSIQNVERALTEAALQHVLNASLTNPLEFEIIYRSYFSDETPRVIAAELAMKPEQVRLIKSRALKKLREHPSVTQMLEQVLVES
ncbi:sigma-70 family RNA polymerase sigma factor [Herpetosiphon llansteffanensis]|uniref:sigma-70 family RNA polymerase sigma factor n=1 Tax=Herpetosiphon llansteffanensis TaxID=2094568 RepID=UPI000D7C7F79|nr:sigma-70 family RNA polymerase sigma factor [Herpetosiphon llansteffanensis]